MAFLPLVLLSFSHVVLVALAAGGPAVLEVTPSNILSHLEASSRPLLLEMYAPWCGHCKHLLPQFAAAARDPAASSLARFGSLNCEEHKATCESFGVTGYPVVLLIPPRQGSIASALSSSRRFEGARTEAGIKDFLFRMTAPPIERFACGGGGLEAASKSASATTVLSGDWDVLQWLRTKGRDGVAFLYLDAAVVENSAASKALLAAATSRQDTLTFATLSLQQLFPSSSSSSSSAISSNCPSSLVTFLAPLVSKLSPAAIEKAWGTAGGGLLLRLEAPLTTAGNLPLPANSKESVKKMVGSSSGSLSVALTAFHDANAAAAAIASASTDPSAMASFPLAALATSLSKSSSPEGSSQDGASSSTGGKGLFSTLIWNNASGAIASDDDGAVSMGSGFSSLFGRGEPAQIADGSLVTWVERNRFRTLSAITPDNFPGLANNAARRPLAIAVVEGGAAILSNGGGSKASSSSSVDFLTTFSKLAHHANPNSSPFLYAWLDGDMFASFIENYGIKPSQAPTILVLDSPTKRFWLYPAISASTAGSMRAFLSSIADGTLPPQRGGFLAFPQRVINVIGLIPAVAIFSALVTAFAYALWKLLIVDFCCPSANSDYKKQEGGADASAAASDDDELDRSIVATAANRGKASSVISAKKQQQQEGSAKVAAAPRSGSKAQKDETAQKVDEDVGDIADEHVSEDDVDEDNEEALEKAKAKDAKLGYKRSFRLTPEEAISDTEEERSFGKTASWRSKVGGGGGSASSTNVIENSNSSIASSSSNPLTATSPADAPSSTAATVSPPSAAAEEAPAAAESSSSPRRDPTRRRKFQQE